MNCPQGKMYLLTIMKDHRLMSGSFPMLLIFLLTLNIGIAKWQQSLEVELRANLLLDDRGGAATASPRYDKSVGSELNSFWKDIPDATVHDLVVLSGMSQMYAINDSKPGDETISELLDDALAPSGTRVFGLSAPNLNNEEALFLLLAAASDPQTHPRAFIYGVCFDKFRNIDLRPGYQSFLDSRPAVAAAFRDAAIASSKTYPLASEKMLRSLTDARAQAKAAGEKTVEARLSDAAAKWIPMIRARKDLNSVLQLALFKARNFILGIKPSSKRPIIPSRYELNRQFLELMIDLAREKHVELLLYMIPLNPLAENPYVPAQYQEFKAWLERLCRERSVPFANLENAVPSEHWGEFMGGPDFKHFKAEGHKITKEALMSAFGDRIQAATVRRQ